MLQYQVYLRQELGLIGEAARAGEFIVAVGGSRLAEIGLPSTPDELRAVCLDRRSVGTLVERLPDAHLVSLAGLISTWRNDGAARMLAEAARWTLRNVPVADIEKLPNRPIAAESDDRPTAIGWPSGVGGYRLIGSANYTGQLPASDQPLLEVCVPEIFTRTEGAVHTTRYGIGDRIAPGRWGLLTRAAGPADRHFYRESVWEEVREQEFSDRPSRFTCGFAWVGQPGWTEPDPQERVYEVVWQTSDAFFADPSWLKDADDVPFAELVRRARRYWEGSGTRHEALVPDDLTVVRVLR